MSIRDKITRRKASKYLSLGSAALFIPPSIRKSSQGQMNKRSIPSTGEQLPIVGLGTWQTFDVGDSEQERAPLREVLKILVDNGGSVIDSSPMYGRSEDVVGELTSEMNSKNSLFEATKVWTSGQEKGVNQMQRSMDLMKVQKMDLMQIHNLLDWKTHLKTLRQWKDEGKIRYIGITHYHKGGYSDVAKILKTEEIDFLQINYNLAVRDASDVLLPMAKDKGVAVLINRPYQGGTLFRKAKNQSLPDWAGEFDATSWGQFFLKFILSHHAVTCVIPGTSKAKHMLDNVQAGFGSLPNSDHQKKMIDWISA